MKTMRSPWSSLPADWVYRPVDGRDPEGERINGHVGIAALVDQRLEFFRRVEGIDRHGQIQIGGRGLEYQFGDKWHDPGQVPLVDLPEPADVGSRQFKTDEDAARLQHSFEFLKGQGRVGDVPHAE